MPHDHRTTLLLAALAALATILAIAYKVWNQPDLDDDDDKEEAPTLSRTQVGFLLSGEFQPTVCQCRGCTSLVAQLRRMLPHHA